MNQYYTPTELAQLLRLNTETIYRWLRQQRIAAINLGSSNRPQWRIPEQAVRQLTGTNKQTDPPRKRRAGNKFNEAAWNLLAKRSRGKC